MNSVVVSCIVSNALYCSVAALPMIYKASALIWKRSFECMLSHGSTCSKHMCMSSIMLGCMFRLSANCLLLIQNDQAAQSLEGNSTLGFALASSNNTASHVGVEGCTTIGDAVLFNTLGLHDTVASPYEVVRALQGWVEDGDDHW